MLAKLLALLSTAKGAAAATVIAAAVAGTGVTATNHDVQNALKDAIKNVTERAESSERPAVVTARNDADKKLRDAFQADQRKLEKLRDTKVEGTDHDTLNDLVKAADNKLKDRLETALDEVAALTKGREGHESDKPNLPERKSSPEVKSSEAKESPDVKVVFTAEMQAKVDLIVATAITDMDKIASVAQTAVAGLPTVTTGKDDAGKAAETGRPAETAKPAESERPEEVKAGSTPTARPTR